jgi:hypothetical protein
MKVRFDTTPWTTSRMTAPRGFGSWAFTVDGTTDVVFTPAMTFTDARKWMTARIRADARFDGIDNVYVDVLP